MHEDYVHIVTYRTIARQRLGKHIPAEANARNNRTSTVSQRISKHAWRIRFQEKCIEDIAEE
jgi:hypothetical protein